MGQVARDIGIRNTSCPTRLASDNTITRNDSHGSLFLPRLETCPRPGSLDPWDNGIPFWNEVNQRPRKGYLYHRRFDHG